MSFLEVPSRIRSTMGIMREAIAERFRAAGYSGYDISGALPEFYPAMTFEILRIYFDDYRRALKRLYSLAFPPGNFGKWSALRPNFFNGGEIYNQNAELENAISADLCSAGIDPEAFFWEYPRRFGKGDFIRACYHLLNNKLLYFAPSSPGFDTRYREIVYTDYEKGKYETYDRPGNGGRPEMVCAYGVLKKQKFHHYNCRFSFAPDGGSLFRKSWKMRYRSTLTRSLRDPVNRNFKAVEIAACDLGEKVIRCSGDFSEIIPFAPAVEVNLDSDRDWGDEHYKYVYCHEQPRLTAVLLSKENFPPLNYKYLD